MPAAHDYGLSAAGLEHGEALLQFVGAADAEGLLPALAQFGLGVEDPDAALLECALEAFMATVYVALPTQGESSRPGIGKGDQA
jgi:hypothetical protein